MVKMRKMSLVVKKTHISAYRRQKSLHPLIDAIEKYSNSEEGYCLRYTLAGDPKAAILLYDPSPKILGVFPHVLRALFNAISESEYAEIMGKSRDTMFPLAIICSHTYAIAKPVGGGLAKGFYAQGDKTIVIATDQDGAVRTLAHELGHWVDTLNSEKEVQVLIKKYESRADKTADFIMENYDA
jgi:hypothetical protein